MTTPAHIQAYVESLTGHPLNRDEGVQHGNAKREVTAVTVAWMATPEAIRAARENRSDLLIVHESLYYPYDVLQSSSPPAGWQDWKINRQRRERLAAEPELTLMRLHGSLDEICIFDTFAELLDLGKPVLGQGVSEREMRVPRECMRVADAVNCIRKPAGTYRYLVAACHPGNKRLLQREVPGTY